MRSALVLVAALSMAADCDHRSKTWYVEQYVGSDAMCFMMTEDTWRCHDGSDVLICISHGNSNGTMCVFDRPGPMRLPRPAEFQ